MYQLVSAKVKNNLSDGDWWDEDLSSLTIQSIITQYRLVHLTLSNDVILVPLYADLYNWLHLPAMDVSMTLEDWFEEIGNLTLPTTQTPYIYDGKTVKYREAFTSLFTVKRAHQQYDPSIDVPVDDKIDLLISKSNIDKNDFTDYCLVSVNGFLHMVEANERGIYVHNGAEMSKENDERKVGIYSFANLAKIKLVPFTEVDLYAASTSADYKDSVFVHVGENLSNKTVLLSLGGYFHALDNCYSIVGEETIKIDFRKIGFVRRLIESKKYINLDSLGLTENQFNESALIVEEILSNEVIEKYFHLSQSFLIIVDTPNLYVQRHVMENGRLPGIYFHPESTLYPMVLDNGRLGEYVEITEEYRTQYCVVKNEQKHYMFETIDWQNQLLVDNSKDIYFGQHHADAVLLEIGCF